MWLLWVGKFEIQNLFAIKCLNQNFWFTSVNVNVARQHVKIKCGVNAVWRRVQILPQFQQAEEKNRLLRSVAGGGLDTISSLRAKWDKFELVMESHQLMIKEQVQTHTNAYTQLFHTLFWFSTITRGILQHIYAFFSFNSNSCVQHYLQYVINLFYFISHFNLVKLTLITKTEMKLIKDI